MLQLRFLKDGEAVVFPLAMVASSCDAPVAAPMVSCEARQANVLRYAVLPPSVRYLPERCSICHRKLAAKRSFFARLKSICVVSVGEVK
jgi:hypothetical protein